MRPLFTLAALAGGLLLAYSSAWLSLPLQAATVVPPDSLEFDALVEPYQTIELAAGVDGLVESITVERGDHVTEGQLLATLESSVEHAQLQVARARAESEAAVLSSRAQVRLDAARLQRFEALYVDDFVPLGTIEELETALELSRLALVAAEEARHLAQQEALRAEAFFEQRRVTSPISGVVVERYLSPGELVYRANDGQLLRLAQLDPLRVEIIAPAAAVRDLTLGEEAVVRLELQPEMEVRARVTIIDSVIDAASGTVGVRLELPNPEGRITAGDRCRVLFPGTKR